MRKLGINSPKQLTFLFCLWRGVRKLWAHLMGKKEFTNIEDNILPEPSGISSIRAGLSNKAFGIIKFILGICLLPFVYTSSVSFINEFTLIERPLQNYFWSGIITFLFIYLFIWEPVIIYTKGQKLLELVFSFFKPLVRVAPYLLPIYTIVLFIVYGILSFVFGSAFCTGGASALGRGGKSSAPTNYFIFLFGFSMGLHLVFSAKSIRSRKNDFLKGNYIFGFSFVYIINVLLLTFCLNLVFDKFSFVNFFNNSFQIAKDIFYAVFKQLFLNK